MYLDEFDSTIQIDARYAGSDNFVGRPVDGYENERIAITFEAARALSMVQGSLADKGLGLKVLDAYRPQRAVDQFMRWTESPADTSTKSTYYPHLRKSDLVPQGYIWKKSGHSRGSTVDLTLVYSSGQEADMGTPWDYFGPESWPSYSDIPDSSFVLRQLLRAEMMQAGFSPLREEWWHFTLKKEPFPDSYFDFVP